MSQRFCPIYFIQSMVNFDFLTCEAEIKLAYKVILMFNEMRYVKRSCDT